MTHAFFFRILPILRSVLSVSMIFALFCCFLLMIILRITENKWPFSTFEDSSLFFPKIPDFKKGCKKVRFCGKFITDRCE